MIRRLSLILLLLPLACLAGLEWETEKLELPAEAGQTEVVGVFKFTNAGDTPVKILRTQSSCGCTVPELEKDTYAPGESGELKAIFTVGDRTGLQRKVLTVVTDDPDLPETRLTLETDIPTIAKIRPKLLLWRLNSEPEWKAISVETDPANKLSIPKSSDDLELPPYELNPDADIPGLYALRLHPTDTEKRSQYQFPVVVELPSGEKKTFKVHMLVR